jgi:mRNA-degrading endonuclease RelE of RelBE toxin-antitoxin system
MYNVDFTGTGRMTLHNFNPKKQKQILSILNKIVSNYEEKAPDNKQIRYLGDEFYVIKINNTISVMVKIQNATFKIIDVFNHVRSESLAIA